MRRNHSKAHHKVNIQIRPRSREALPASSGWAGAGGTLDELRREFNQTFSPFVELPRATSLLPNLRVPNMDLLDEGDHYEVRVELPGVPKEKIDVTINPGRLEIRGSAATDREERRKNYFYRETSDQSFYRSIRLPDDVNADEATADLADGCLTVKLPKKWRPRRGRRITIE